MDATHPSCLLGSGDFPLVVSLFVRYEATNEASPTLHIACRLTTCAHLICSQCARITARLFLPPIPRLRRLPATAMRSAAARWHRRRPTDCKCGKYAVCPRWDGRGLARTFVFVFHLPLLIRHEPTAGRSLSCDRQGILPLCFQPLTPWLQFVPAALETDGGCLVAPQARLAEACKGVQRIAVACPRQFRTRPLGRAWQCPRLWLWGFPSPFGRGPGARDGGDPPLPAKQPSSRYAEATIEGSR